MNPIAIKIFAGLGICVACAFGGGYVVNDHWEAKYNAEKLQMQEEQNAAIQQGISDNAAALADQRKTHKDEIQKYEERHDKDAAEIARNRAAVANGGLYLPRSACNQIAGETKATNAGQGNGADQAAFRLPTGIETGLLAIATRADTEASELENRLAMCQQFARDNGFAPVVDREEK
jgi:hypothetical protein